VHRQSQWLQPGMGWPRKPAGVKLFRALRSGDYLLPHLKRESMTSRKIGSL
jgi:hypothetical protein